MKKNKLWVIIVSVLFFSTVLFTGCKNSFIENKENNNESTNTEQTQNTNQNEEGNNSQSDSKIILKNHQKGIEIGWKNIPAETKIIEICVSYDGYGYTTFTIYDLDQVKSVIDEYVTPGKEYEYTIIFHKNNMNIIERTAWISIVAQNGKGEPDFSIESTEQGSHIIAQRNADKSQIKIQKTDAQNNIKYYWLNQKTGNIDFTDKYVTADSRYDYSVYEEIGNNGEWYNNVIINADPVVRQLRWKTKSVPAIGGVGDIKLANPPAATFNSIDGSITFTTVPQFSQTPNSWRMSFNYKIGNSNYTLYSIDSEETNTELYRGLQGGLYTFERSPTRLIYDDFELSFDLGPDSLTNIPQTINIIPPDKPVLTATPTDEGILFEWANLPLKTKKIIITNRKNSNSWKEIDINDVTTVTSVTDKHVSNGTTYECNITAYDENGDWIETGAGTTVIATGGLGDGAVLNVTSASDGIHLVGQVDSSASDYTIWKNLSTDSQNEPNDYITLTDDNSSFDVTDYFVSPGTTYKYTVRETIGNQGTWINDILTGTDDIVEIRNSITTVTATGGYGENIITNKPSVSFDTLKEALIFSEAPQVVSSPNYYIIRFCFKNSNNETRQLFAISTSSGLICSAGYKTEGQWTFDYMIFDFNYVKYQYHHQKKIRDLSAFQSFPQTVNITDANKPRLSVTPTNEGLLFQWENAPLDVNQIEIGITKNFLEDDTIGLWLNNKDTNSFLYKYIDADTDYVCLVGFFCNDGSETVSNEVSVTTTAGLGEIRLTNMPAASFDSNTVSFTEPPQILGSDGFRWEIYFDYSDANNHKTLYDLSSTSQNPQVTINYVPGTWYLRNYGIAFYTESFHGSLYYQDISKLINLPQTIVLSEENQFRLIATPTSEGIKLEWENLPKNTSRLIISDIYEELYGSRFDIHNLRDVSYVIDKYVTSGKEYTYSLSAKDENNSNLGETKKVTVAATGGLGELDFSGTTTSEGVHLTAQRLEDNYFRIYKAASDEKHTGFHSFEFSGNSSTYVDIVDKWVTSGKEYTYYITEQIGQYGNTPDDIIEYPRHKKVTITPTSGFGEPKIINNPVAAYDSENNEISFSIPPQVSGVSESNTWRCIFDYSTFNNNTFRYTCDGEGYTNIWYSPSSGTYTLRAYRIEQSNGSFTYSYYEEKDLSNLSGIPQSFTF